MIKNNGGPAFPGLYDENGNQLYASTGMTLRDYFAGQVMQGYLTRQTISPDFENTAGLAYIIADAMLKERDNG